MEQVTVESFLIVDLEATGKQRCLAHSLVGVQKTKSACCKSEVCSYEPLKPHIVNVINKASFSYCMRCITFWPLILFFNYEEMKKQIKIELGFLYAFSFPLTLPIWKLFLLVRKFQNLWYLKQRVLSNAASAFLLFLVP